MADALNATTSKPTWTDTPTKASETSHNLVWKLASEYRRARRIHLIVDNYIIHSSKKTQRFLAQLGDHVGLHFLPPYSADDNRIERAWLDPHADVTELMVQVVAPLRAYDQRKKVNPCLMLAAGVSRS